MLKLFLFTSVFGFTFITPVFAIDEPGSVNILSHEMTFDEGIDEDTDKVSRFGLTCLYISSDLPVTHINFQYRDGDWPIDQWRNATVYKGQVYWISYRYNTPGVPISPDLYVRFDSDFHAVGTSVVTYSLVRFASPEQDCNRYGKRYYFSRDNGSNRYIDLVQ